MHCTLASACEVPPPDGHTAEHVMQDNARIAMLRRTAMQDAMLPLYKHTPLPMHFKQAEPRQARHRRCMAQSMRIRPQLPRIHIALSIIHTHDAPRLQVYIDMHAPRTRLDRTSHKLMHHTLERRPGSYTPLTLPTICSV